MHTFLVQNWSFSVFWHYKNEERLSNGLDVKWHIPSTCLDASRKWFSTGIYSINKAGRTGCNGYFANVCAAAPC